MKNAKKTRENFLKESEFYSMKLNNATTQDKQIVREQR